MTVTTESFRERTAFEVPTDREHHAETPSSAPVLRLWLRVRCPARPAPRRTGRSFVLTAARGPRPVKHLCRNRGGGAGKDGVRTGRGGFA